LIIPAKELIFRAIRRNALSSSPYVRGAADGPVYTVGDPDIRLREVSLIAAPVFPRVGQALRVDPDGINASLFQAV
jgi:hypothetical protein